MRLWFENIRWLWTGKTQISDAVLLVESGKILWVGPRTQIPAIYREQAEQFRKISLNNFCVLPAFCDCHTHLIYVGERAEEWVWRLQGRTYQEIAQMGGGIHFSARLFAQSSDEQILEETHQRLLRLLQMGTAAVEIKTGYGLEIEEEIRAVRLCTLLQERFPGILRITVQALHALPSSYRNRKTAYIRAVCERLIPACAEMADFCDVFCEEGFFSVEESLQVLETAWKYGLPAKIHAHQFGRSGGIDLALRFSGDLVSVDHLEVLSAEDIHHLQELSRNRNVTLVFLPASTLFLRKSSSCVRILWEDPTLSIAVASDWNPGTCPTGNLYLVWFLACQEYRQTPERVLDALTTGGARAMRLDSSLGSLTPGKDATFQVVQPASSLATYPYTMGEIPVHAVYVKGVKVAGSLSA